MTKRPLNKSYKNYWEFPGGKCEENESFEEAAIREMKEELGIVIKKNDLISLDMVNHSYKKNEYIIMCVFLIKKWFGKIKSKEKQDFAWFNMYGPFPKKFLDGGTLILKRLQLKYYKI